MAPREPHLEHVRLAFMRTVVRLIEQPLVLKLLLEFALRLLVHLVLLLSTRAARLLYRDARRVLRVRLWHVPWLRAVLEVFLLRVPVQVCLEARATLVKRDCVPEDADGAVRGRKRERVGNYAD